MGCRPGAGRRWVGRPGSQPDSQPARRQIQARPQRQQGQHVPGEEGIRIAQARQRDRQQDGGRRMEVALEEDLVGPSPVIHVVRQANLLRLETGLPSRNCAPPPIPARSRGELAVSAR